jgi:hypothetical protein
MNWNPNQRDPYSPPHSAFQPPGGQNPYGQSAYGQGPYAHNPYGHQPPPRSGGSWLWLWILLAVGGGMFLFCCGGCGLLAYIGMNQEEGQIKAQIAGQPAIVEHIGEIVTLERDWSKSIDEEDPNTWYFRVVGTVGEGDLIVKEVEGLHLDEDEIQIEWAKLRLDSGEEFDVLP